MWGPPDTFVDRVRERMGPAGGLSVFYACLFFGYGVAMPYLNPWLASRGLSVSDIALLASATAVTRIFAGPIAGVVADRRQSHRLVLIVLSWASFAAWFTLGHASVFWQFLTAQLLVAAVGAGLIPLIETLATAAARAQTIDYGRVRLWGSVSFIVATLAAGVVVDWIGIRAVIAILIGAAAVTALATLVLPRAAEATTRPPVKLADSLALACSPLLLLFLTTASLAQCSHAVLYVFATLHWQSLGYSNTWCGLLFAIAVIAEIVVFWYAPQLRQWLTPVRLIAMGLGAGVVRWVVMGFDPPLLLLAPLQVLHGFTYGAAHLGAMQLLARIVPSEQAGTAQSLHALATGGIGMAIATQIAGATYASAGGRAYWSMAALSAAGVVFLALFVRRAGDQINARE